MKMEKSSFPFSKLNEDGEIEFSIHLHQSCGDLKPLFEPHGYRSIREFIDILSEFDSSQYEICAENESNISLGDYLMRIASSNQIGKSRKEQHEDCGETFFIDKDGFEFLDEWFS